MYEILLMYEIYRRRAITQVKRVTIDFSNWSKEMQDHLLRAAKTLDTVCEKERGRDPPWPSFQEKLEEERTR